jgi:Protein of unknown function (DUF3293)
MRAALTDRLRLAYRAAHYRFDVPGAPLLLQVDQHSAALQQLLRDAGRSCAAALTAFNPRGELQAEHSNLHAQQQLVVELEALWCLCILGRHEDPKGQWPPEISALALGLDRPNAHALAARYGQLAFLWCDASGTPRLVETGADAN